MRQRLGDFKALGEGRGTPEGLPARGGHIKWVSVTTGADLYGLPKRRLKDGWLASVGIQSLVRRSVRVPPPRLAETCAVFSSRM